MIGTAKRKRVLLLGAIALLAAVAPASHANVVGDIGKSISSLWSQKARKQQAAHQARSKASAQSQQVQFAHDRLVKTQQLLESANDRYQNYFRQMRHTEAQLVETRQKVQDATDRYEAHRTLFGQRLAALQRHGQTNYLQVAFGAQSLADLTRRTAFFQALTQRDAQLQSELESDKTDLTNTQNSLMAQWNQRNKLQKESNEERERIAAGESQQAKNWSQLSQSRLQLFNYALSQEQSSQRINGMIGSLQSRKARILADYQAQAARDRAAMRSQARFQARVRHFIRYTRRYRAPQPRYTRYRAPQARYNRRSSGGRHTIRYGGPMPQFPSASYAPRVDLNPRYAPRIQLAPMPIEALQKTGSVSLPPSLPSGVH